VNHAIGAGSLAAQEESTDTVTGDYKEPK